MKQTRDHTTQKPDWIPLERAIEAIGLPNETCAEFMWMYRSGGAEHYKHYGTRRYIALTRASVLMRGPEALRLKIADVMGATVLS